jgi:hypothetical protein
MNLVLYTDPAFFGLHNHQHFTRMLLLTYQRHCRTLQLRKQTAVLRSHAVACASCLRGTDGAAMSRRKHCKPFRYLGA